jgi:hypothetical protein
MSTATPRVAVDEEPALQQSEDELAQQARVAARAMRQRRHERLGRVRQRRQEHVEHRRDVVFAERLDRPHRDPARRLQLLRALGDVLAGDHHREMPLAAEDLGEHLPPLVVRVVHVVEEEHHRAHLAFALDQAPHGPVGALAELVRLRLERSEERTVGEGDPRDVAEEVGRLRDRERIRGAERLRDGRRHLATHGARRARRRHAEAIEE